MTEHRIITNGAKFRIEKLVHHRFLWWKWDRWETVRYRGAMGYYHLEYDDLVTAKSQILAWEEQEAVKQQPWQVVEKDP